MAADSFWAIVVAAGQGQRLGAEVPKALRVIAGKPLLVHTLVRLAEVPELAGMVVVVQDEAWLADVPTLPIPLVVAAGGAERVDSVRAGLTALVAEQGPNTWALVHDVARPGVRAEDVVALMTHCRATQQGAILALPVRDTVKQVRQQQSYKTLDREAVWLAQTPQCFRAESLLQALAAAQQAGETITDEASAMEWYGQPVGVVAGHWRNFKLTEPADWPLLEWILTHD
jgi:2-C-methyl-D-erythritol 4-phosphate cytidylyltransferase